MILKVDEWRILEHVPDFGKEPTFSVYIADPEVSIKPLLLPFPYTGMTDTTIDPGSHDLYIDPDVVRSNSKKTGKEHIFFRKKSLTDAGGEIKSSEFHNTPAGGVFGDRIKSRRKAIIDETTGAAVTVSEDAVAMGAQGQEIVAGEKGIMSVSGEEMKVPGVGGRDNILLKETGLMRIMPKAFIPPFSIPDFLPNLLFLKQIEGTVAIFKALRDATQRGL